jgi:hypothetical protein
MTSGLDVGSIAVPMCIDTGLPPETGGPIECQYDGTWTGALPPCGNPQDRCCGHLTDCRCSATQLAAGAVQIGPDCAGGWCGNALGGADCSTTHCSCDDSC